MQGSVKEKKTPAIQMARVKLEKSIAATREEFNILRNRLAPVLSPHPEELSKGVVIGSNEIPLAAELDQLTAQVNSLYSLVQATNQELEL